MASGQSALERLTDALLAHIVSILSGWAAEGSSSARKGLGGLHGASPHLRQCTSRNLTFLKVSAAHLRPRATRRRIAADLNAFPAVQRHGSIAIFNTAVGSGGSQHQWESQDVR
ncbi:hypothetical protein WJX72_003700 [[Myrmecia] bisecta]|uniref:Uncharacterized protein n=1 Tax=[Myrmecia] bisecta TaxID=41462 RepID=A0AAW1PWY4_9CHLO